MRNPKAQVDRTFAGPALADYAAAAGVLTAGVARPAPGNGYFVITAEDGARVAVSLAEAAPGPGDNGVILATEQDGEPRFMAGAVLVATRRDGAALGAEGPARLVVPGDRGPGRWVRSLVSLTLREG